MKAKRSRYVQDPYVRPLLTPRQREIIAAIKNGATNRTIADQLGLTVAMVKVHVRATFRMLGLANRTQPAIVANDLE